MGSKNDPGQFDCYANALPDEPMFVLLARDPLAPFLTQIWAMLRAGNRNEASATFKKLIAAPQSAVYVLNPEPEKAIEASDCALAMAAWRIGNDGAWRKPADDDAGDPTKPGLLKPRGNNGVVNAEICHNSLLLMGDVAATPGTVAAWTQEQRDVAYDWAIRCHLSASDNDDVLVPARPAFIPRARPRQAAGR